MRTRALALVGLSLAVLAGPACARRYEYHGAGVGTPFPAPKVVLTDTAGAWFELPADLRGNVGLIFFGYTACPDVCPTTLQKLATVRWQLRERERQVQVVFVSVDPQSDKPEQIRRYLDGFDETFVGLTGSAEAIATARKAFGIHAGDMPGGAPGLLSHTEAVILIDQAGNWFRNYHLDDSAQDIASDVRHLLDSS
jgi:protein SCO1/2